MPVAPPGQGAKGEQAASRVPVRIRFALGTAASVLAVAAGLASVLFVGVGRLVSSEVEAQVRSDLRLARAAHDEELSRLEGGLEEEISDRSLQSHPSSVEGPEDLAEALGSLRRRIGLDALTLVGPDGVVVESSGGLGAAGDDWSGQILVARVLRGRRAVAGALVVPDASLASEGAGLAERARIEVEPTADASPPAPIRLAVGRPLLLRGARGRAASSRNRSWYRTSAATSSMLGPPAAAATRTASTTRSTTSTTARSRSSLRTAPTPRPRPADMPRMGPRFQSRRRPGPAFPDPPGPGGGRPRRVPPHPVRSGCADAGSRVHGKA